MIFVGTHHKTGTNLFRRVFTEVSAELGLKLYKGWQDKLPADAAVWFMPHSRQDNCPQIRRGIHVVRHPFNLIMSAYRYHKICSERWAINVDTPTQADSITYNFDGLSYQQKLNSLPETEGIEFEMRGRSYDALMDAYRWEYSDQRFLNVRFEDISADFDREFARIFEWLGLPLDPCLNIAARHDLNRMEPETVEGMVQVTDKKRRGSVIVDLPPKALAAFVEIFPADLCERLGAL